MITYKVFKPGILVVLVFVLLGMTTMAQAQEGTREASEMDPGSDSEAHTIVLINNEFSPGSTEVNQYDTVVWRNLNRPKRAFVLVSEDNLWEDFTLGYGRSFEYTFNETGTFGFSIEGERDMAGTVVIRESNETAGSPRPEREIRQIQQEETEQQKVTEQEEETEQQKVTEPEEEITSAPTEEITPRQTAEKVQSSENSVLIQGSAFYPETLELDRGETLVWKNLNRPKRSFTLVSEDELFEDQNMGYGRSFSYTFDEAGDYTFKLDEVPDSELTVTVK